MIGFLTGLPLWGTMVNAFGVIAGALVGIIIKRFSGKKKEDNKNEESFGTELSDAIMKGVALCVMLIGITGAITTNNIMIVIVSMVIGAVIGTLCRLDKGISGLGDFIEKKTGGKLGSITQGFVTASLLFCVGAMAIVGSLESGLVQDHNTLYAKSLLDMIAAVIFATTLGWGVVFSAGLVFIYQGAITLAANLLAPVLSDPVITEMTAVGSLLIIALSLNMLGLTKIKVMNYVPAIFIPIPLMWALGMM
jgi:uncharacterized membrane protein YqgA involved in biofilm formation